MDRKWTMKINKRTRSGFGDILIEKEEVSILLVVAKYLVILSIVIAVLIGIVKQEIAEGLRTSEELEQVMKTEDATVGDFIESCIVTHQDIRKEKEENKRSNQIKWVKLTTPIVSIDRSSDILKPFHLGLGSIRGTEYYFTYEDMGESKFRVLRSLKIPVTNTPPSRTEVIRSGLSEIRKFTRRAFDFNDEYTSDGNIFTRYEIHIPENSTIGALNP